ncbi:MAG: phenylpropionate dioxygenase-like ring-hydroxylating dioxygenase large terminal subunit [Bacteroidia bacterium]|jgi:phenylpropionate dioxygenase-like ring-hydroxylating dioxygenase large terminal subunit
MTPPNNYTTPSIDRETPLPGLGDTQFSGDRFFSPEFMAREWSGLWRRTWNMGPRCEELRKPGDFVVHQLGNESFIFVLGEDREIRGFFNVCQHRGRRLESEQRAGNARFFRCIFHGWSWNTDGSLKGVPDPKTYPQFSEGIPSQELGLTPVRVDTWGGWVWFNIDAAAEPLLQYLDVLPEHLAPYRMQDMRVFVNATFLWDCNWKIAVDAFNESYHFRGIHPEMMTWSNASAKLEILGRHSRMINEYGAPSDPHRDTEEISERMAAYMRYFGLDPATWTGPAREVRIEKQKMNREQQRQGVAPHLPYAEMTDEQLSDVYHYFYFPGAAQNIFPEGVNTFRYRPHESDPSKCYYDLIMMAHFPAGEEPEDVEHQYFDHKIQYADLLDPAVEVASFILQQDADNVPAVQQGVESEGFRGMNLSEQEIRVRHFHNLVEHYLAENERS